MDEVSEQLQKAIDTLSINDVYVKSCRAHCEMDFDAKSNAIDSLQMQQMHIVHRSEIVKIEGDGELVRIYVQLGTRWIEPEGADAQSEPIVKAYIEADFIAEYQLNGELEQAAIDEYAAINVNFHVWPYWREHLSSQCERLRLPRLVAPNIQFNRK